MNQEEFDERVSKSKTIAKLSREVNEMYEQVKVATNLMRMQDQERRRNVQGKGSTGAHNYGHPKPEDLEPFKTRRLEIASLEEVVKTTVPPEIYYDPVKWRSYLEKTGENKENDE